MEKANTPVLRYSRHPGFCALCVSNERSEWAVNISALSCELTGRLCGDIFLYCLRNVLLFLRIVGYQYEQSFLRRDPNEAIYPGVLGR
jgi:hypothetical protein